MWKVGLEDVLRTLVESMLPRFSLADEGLLVTLDARMGIFSDNGENDRHTSRMFHILYNRPDNYTKVFVAINNSWNLADIKPDDWENTCDHDSCWTSDGTRPIYTAWFEMSEELEGFTDKPSISCCIKSVHRVKVELERYKDPGKFRQLYRPVKVELTKP